MDQICQPFIGWNLFGTDFESVQNIGNDKNDIVHIRYKSGLDVILQIQEGLSLPIEFTCYSNSGQQPYKSSFTDPDFKSYFMGFYNMLEAFTNMVKTGKQPIPFSELVKISKVVIAGEVSRQQGGKKIFLEDLK
jgi:hypothetical protein